MSQFVRFEGKHTAQTAHCALQSTGARCLNLGFGKRQLSSAAATFQCYLALLLRLLAAASCGTQQNLILFHLHTSSMHHRWDHRHNIGDERRNWGVRMLCKNLVSLISNGQGWMVKYATLALIFCSRSLHLSSTNSQNICLSRYSVGTRAGGLWHNQLLRGCKSSRWRIQDFKSEVSTMQVFLVATSLYSLYSVQEQTSFKLAASLTSSYF